VNDELALCPLHQQVGCMLQAASPEHVLVVCVCAACGGLGAPIFVTPPPPHTHTHTQITNHICWMQLICHQHTPDACMTRLYTIFPHQHTPLCPSLQTRSPVSIMLRALMAGSSKLKS
jgi:hypothetical protein